MGRKYTHLFLVEILILAVGLTLIAGAVSPDLAAQPFGRGIWWHTALRLAVPAVWMFLFWFLVIRGAAWIIAALQRRDRRM